MAGPPGATARRLVPLVVALGCAAIALAPALPGDRALVARDLPHLFYPLGKVVASATRQGNLLPRRDPTVGLGIPLVSDMVAESFYPGRFVRAVLPYPVGFKVYILLHLALAGVAAAAVARALGASTGGMALAAAAGATCGPMLSLHPHTHLLAGTGWCTLALAALLASETATGSRRFIYVVGAALATTLALFTGAIEAVLGLALALGGLVVFAGRRGIASRAARTVSALVLGGALAAVQLVPTSLYVATTTRSGTLDAADAMQWSTHPLRLLGVVAPSLFHLDGLPPWSELFEGNPRLEPFLSSLYLSIPVLVLAAIAAVRDARCRAVAAAAGIVIIAALGRFGAPDGLPSFMDLLRHVPPYDRFRYPEKLLPFALLLLAGLGGVGFSQLLRRQDVRAFAWGSAVVFLPLLSVAALVWQRPDIVPLDPAIQPAIRTMIASAIVHAFSWAGLHALGCAAAITVAARLGATRARLVAALVGLATVGALLVDSHAQLVIGPARWLDQPPASARAILDHPTSTPIPRVVYGLAKPLVRPSDLPETVVEPRLVYALSHREALIGGWAGLFGLEQAWIYSPFIPARLNALFVLGRTHPDRLAYLAAIGAATFLPEDRYAPEWTREPIPGTGFLLGRVPAGPRVRFVTRARPAADLAAASAQASSDTYDPRQEAIVEGLDVPVTGSGEHVSKTVLVSRQPDRIEVALDPPTSAPGVLVLSELFVDGGWTATVDGVATRVLPADVALVSVVVPAGARTAVFRARTPGLAAGACVSVVTAGLLGLVAQRVRRGHP